MTQIEVISKYVITRRIEIGSPINNLDLQRLLKIIQDETHLFYDECEDNNGIIRYPNIYYRFAGWGVMPITFAYRIKVSDNEKRVLDNIIDSYVDNVTRILKER